MKAWNTRISVIQYNREAVCCTSVFYIVLFSLVYSELEAKQKTELQMRNLQLDLRTANNNIKQVNQQQTGKSTSHW